MTVSIAIITGAALIICIAAWLHRQRTKFDYDEDQSSDERMITIMRQGKNITQFGGNYEF